jgi:hypothetical protein
MAAGRPAHGGVNARVSGNLVQVKVQLVEPGKCSQPLPVGDLQVSLVALDESVCFERPDRPVDVDWREPRRIGELFLRQREEVAIGLGKPGH